MPIATAAYCSACQAHVFVDANGGCEFGHSRASLRNIYSAEIDRKTGRPLPPGFDQRAQVSRPVAPVAPVALEPEPLAQRATYDASEFSISAPFAPVITAMGAGALSQTLVISESRTRGLRRVFGRHVGRSAVRHADTTGLVSMPLLVALAAVSVLAIVVSVAL